MNIYKITRTDRWGYDEYDTHIIIADNTEEVVKLANSKEHHTYDGVLEGKNWSDESIITLEGTYTNIGDNTPFILLSSFNAG